MSLVRVKNRRIITLTNFSFADGEIRLVHPRDIPYSTFVSLIEDPHGVEEYVLFSCTEGATPEDDAEFVIEMSPEEVIEFAEKLGPYLTEPLQDPGASGTALGDDLDEQAEGLIEAFGKLLGALPEPEIAGREDDSESDGEDDTDDPNVG